MRDVLLLQGRTVRRFPPEEEGAAEKACSRLGLTTSPIASSLYCCGGGGSRTGPENKGGVEGRGVLKIWSYFSLSYSESTDQLVVVLFELN